MTKKKKKKKGPKKYKLELSAKSIFLWTICLICLLAWIFGLGVFVGSGFLPEGIRSYFGLKSTPSINDSTVENKNASNHEFAKKPVQDPKFAFYEKLSTKKEDVVRKRKSKRVKQKKRPKKETGTVKASKKIEKKTFPPVSKEHFTVQIASLENEDRAAKLVEDLVDRDYPAYFYKTALNGKIIYRVRCGLFETSEEARKFNRFLALKENIKGFISKVEE